MILMDRFLFLPDSLRILYFFLIFAKRGDISMLYVEKTMCMYNSDKKWQGTSLNSDGIQTDLIISENNVNNKKRSRQTIRF